MNKLNLIVLIFLISCVMAYIFFGNNANDINNPQNTQNESLAMKGSDTEVQLVSNLAEAFTVKNSNADISVTGGGSGVGIAALINGEIDLANSSRAMKQDEISQSANRGLDVQEFILAIDGLTVITHSENPINQLSIDQLGKIYKGEIKNWKEVGGNDTPIVLYGRQSTSGTYNFFRDSVVNSDYSSEMKTMEGNQAIVEAVKQDTNGIGYVGVGYAKNDKGEPRQDIKIILLHGVGEPPVSPLDELAVKDGRYPIARPIFQYIPRLPLKNSILERYLQFEASNEGQIIIENAGFYSLNDEYRNKNQQLFNKIK